MKANKHLATVMAATMVAGSVVPVMAETTNEALIGKNRIETAVKISKDGWNSAETVILVNDGAIADALTATPLAFAKNAPILLTSKNGLSAQVKAEIKRLEAKNVMLIGGNTVLPASIEKELKELGLKPDRIKGDTREETALAIAKRLDAISDVSEIAVVNGTKGLADAVSVAAAAAERHMPILLANPKKGLSASEKFIKDEAIKASYLIGGTTVLPNKMVSSLPGKKRLEGSNRNDTNAKVIETFYKGKELKNVYVAKDGRGGDSQLIDALAVGVLAAKNASPVLIASKNLNAKQVNVINTKEVSNIVQVGGKGNEGAFNHLKEIEKEDVYEVETVEELKEALAKANANDKIVLKPNATITEDIIINTDKNVDIKVEGTVTGKVEITAPNGNVANNSTSKPETNKPSGGGSTGGTVVSPSVSSVTATISGNDINVEAIVSNAGNNNAKIEIIKDGKVVTEKSVDVVNGNINCKIENLAKGEYTVKVTVGGSYKVSEKVSIATGLLEAKDEASLKDAIKNAEKGDTISVVKPIYVDGLVEVDKSITINLNKNTITQNNATTKNGDIVVIKGSNLNVSIKNGTLKNEDATQDMGHVGVFIPEGSNNINLNLSDVTIKMAGFAEEDIIPDKTANLFGVYANGNCTGISFNIDRCNISGAAVGVYFPVGSEKISIKDSTITGGTAVGIKGGNGVISNSKLVGTGPCTDERINNLVPNTDGIHEAGEALLIEGNYARNMDIKVENCTLESGNGYGVRMQFFNEKYTKKLSIKGGTVKGKLGAIFNNHSANTNKDYASDSGIFKKSLTTSGVTFEVTDEKSLNNAVLNSKEGDKVVLKNDITLKEAIKLPKGKVEIDLANNNITSEVTDKKLFEEVSDGKKVIIKNGNINVDSNIKTSSRIYVTKGGYVKLEKVNLTTNGSGFYLAGKNATADIIDSTINSKGYCVSTNAKDTTTHGVIYNITNSTLNSNTEDSVGTPVLVNVPCELNMTDCKVNGLYQGVVVRGGKAKLVRTDIVNNSIITNKDDYKGEGNWGEGNGVPRAALVVGNRHTVSYAYPASVELEGCTIEEKSENPAIYMWGNTETNNATLKYDSKTTIKKGKFIKGNEFCNIDGKGLTVESK